MFKYFISFFSIIYLGSFAFADSEKFYDSRTVFAGEEHIFNMGEIVNLYMSEQERVAFLVLFESSQEEEKSVALNLFKKKLLEVFTEELFIAEGLKLKQQTQKKIKKPEIFLLWQGAKQHTFLAEDIRRERQRVKNMVYSYFVSDLGHHNPFFEPSDLTRHKSPIYISPGEVRDYYTAHEDEFVLLDEADVHEIKMENMGILTATFHREALDETLKGRLKKVFYKVLERTALEKEPLTEETKEKLWKVVFEREGDSSIQSSIEESKEVFMEARIDPNILLQPDELAYELNYRFIGQDLYKLDKILDNESYIARAEEIKQRFNSIFPDLIQVKTHTGITQITLNDAVNPLIHGEYAFILDDEGRAKQWLIFVKDLPKPSFFKLRILERHPGKKLGLQDVVKVEVDREHPERKHEITLSMQITEELSRQELERQFKEYTSTIFRNHFNMWHDVQSRSEWLKKLFPDPIYNLNYEEIKNAF